MLKKRSVVIGFILLIGIEHLAKAIDPGTADFCRGFNSAVFCFCLGLLSSDIIRG